MTASTHSPARLHHLLRNEVIEAFDRARFERDGYWVWEGVLTEEGRCRFTASLKEIQRKDDAITMDTDWESIEFLSRGMDPAIPERVTHQAKAACCGGSEQAGFMSGDWREKMHLHGLFGPGPALVTNGFESQGVMPEYFAAAYDDFILDVVTEHPQTMDLQRRLLGDSFILDHLVVLNRAPDSPGRRWHAHEYRDGSNEVQDDIGTDGSLTTEFLAQQCVRTLCYPEGARREEGGKLAIIPGAHLYRIPFKSRGARTDGDEEMKAGWLQGKIHAFTHEPLEIVHLSIPPGSMVSFVHHMPHYVGHRRPGAGVRWGLPTHPLRWAGVPERSSVTTPRPSCSKTGVCRAMISATMRLVRSFTAASRSRTGRSGIVRRRVKIEAPSSIPSSSAAGDSDQTRLR